MARTTLSVIKADVGGYVGHATACPELTAEAEELRGGHRHQPQVFVSGPRKKEFQNIYDFGIWEPVVSLGMKPVRIDREHFVGCIVDEIKKQIGGSQLVIADVTGSNPNVMLEVGLAMGAGIQTVLLCQDPEKLPFDIRHMNHLVYDPLDISDLAGGLRERLLTVTRE